MTFKCIVLWSYDMIWWGGMGGCKTYNAIQHNDNWEMNVLQKPVVSYDLKTDVWIIKLNTLNEQSKAFKHSLPWSWSVHSECQWFGGTPSHSCCSESLHCCHFSIKKGQTSHVTFYCHLATCTHAGTKHCFSTGLGGDVHKTI